MMPTAAPKDLIVLAADGSMKLALEEVLRRYHSLGSERFLTKSFNLNHDPGVLQSVTFSCSHKAGTTSRVGSLRSPRLWP